MIKRKYKRKLVPHWERDAYRIALASIVGSALIGVGVMRVEAFIDTFKRVYENPLISSHNLNNVIVEVDQPDENVHGWTKKYVDRYFTGYERSEMYMIMQCLLHRESGHSDGDKAGKGDGGLAGGTLQFHQATWNRMRGQMLKAGEITEIGNRYNTEQSVHTTVWAINNGNALEWGPILRDSKGSDFAACQTPSWYEEAK